MFVEIIMFLYTYSKEKLKSPHSYILTCFDLRLFRSIYALFNCILSENMLCLILVSISTAWMLWLLLGSGLCWEVCISLLTSIHIYTVVGIWQVHVNVLWITISVNTLTSSKIVKTINYCCLYILLVKLECPHAWIYYFAKKSDSGKSLKKSSCEY